MTAHMSPHPSQKAPILREYRPSMIRTCIMGVLIALLAAGCLFLQQTAFVEFQEYATLSEKKSTSWIAGELGYMLPFLVMVLFQYLVYRRTDRGDGVLEREMARQILIAAALIYLVLWPTVAHISEEQLRTALDAGEKVTQYASDEYQTLFLETLEWFLRMSIPLGLMYFYHSTRATRQECEPDTESEMEPEVLPEISVDAPLTEDAAHAEQA